MDGVDHIQLDYTDGRCSLMIDRVSVDDEAVYTCTAVSYTHLTLPTNREV